MTDAPRKFPLSFTKLAPCGLSEITNVRLANGIEQRSGGLYCLGVAACDNEQPAGRRGVGTTEYRCRDKALATPVVHLCQPL